MMWMMCKSDLWIEKCYSHSLRESEDILSLQNRIPFIMKNGRMEEWKNGRMKTDVRSVKTNKIIKQKYTQLNRQTQKRQTQNKHFFLKPNNQSNLSPSFCSLFFALLIFTES
jgi:hypothetical protein